jgi:Mn-dependent DtxR family transcriptional regulator
VIQLCRETVSVAEIAARLAVPIGVARVIIADMADLGLVEVGRTSAVEGDERDPAFLRRVLSGLQRL